MRRLLLTTIVIATVVPTMAGSAGAGGAVWHFDGYHRPGDIVVTSTSVAWGHNSDLGRPEDGPYLIYMAPTGATGETWPEIPDDGHLVGIVEVHLGSYVAEDGQSYGPNQAVARFEIPDVDPGIYQILHCNDPCTTTLGDIIGGWDLRVLNGPDGRSAEDIAAEVRERLASAPLVMPEDSNAETSGQVLAEVAPVETKPQSGALNDQPVRFDTLWVATVALVSLLLVFQLLHTPR